MLTTRQAQALPHSDVGRRMAALEAEFPDVLVMQSWFFECALPSHCPTRRGAENPVDETRCQRLAKLFSVSRWPGFGRQHRSTCSNMRRGGRRRRGT